MSGSNDTRIEIDEELLKRILFEMMFEEKQNNKNETCNDVQMVAKLVKILEKHL